MEFVWTVEGFSCQTLAEESLPIVPQEKKILLLPYSVGGVGGWVGWGVGGRGGQGGVFFEHGSSAARLLETASITCSVFKQQCR